jgi:hypothetical protein
VPTSQKVTIPSMYIEPEQVGWYQWLCERKHGSIISWSIFIEELIAYHEDIKSNFCFTQLKHLQQKGLVMEHIQQFQKLGLRVNGIPEDRLLDLLIGTLKDNIQHEVCLFEPTSLEIDFRMERKVESKNMVMTTKKFPCNTYRENNAPPSNLPKPKRLMPQQMDERRAKGHVGYGA